MVTVTTSPGWYVSNDAGIDFSFLPYGNNYTSSETIFRVNYDDGWFDQLEGTGFRYLSNGTPVGGTVTTMLTGVDDEVGVRISGMSVSVNDIVAVADTDDTYDDHMLALKILAGDDRISGADLGDYLDGYGGNDVLIGNGGNDVLTGYGGNDSLDGGAGFDEAIFLGARREYVVNRDGAAWKVSTTGFDGTDSLTGVEQFSFVDGRLVFDDSDATAVTYRMYDAMFGRAPDALGFNYWVSALQKDTTGEEMADVFASSREFLSTYGNLSNRDFVDRLYQNVLHRDGETDGLAFWTGEIDNGTMSRGQVLLGFSESTEHKNNLRPVVEAGLWDVDEDAATAARLYSAAFDRSPDVEGLKFWAANLRDGAWTTGSVADVFAQSVEFTSKYGPLSNAEFVDQLYLNVLDRPGEVEGTSFWTNQLNTGALDRGDVLLGFSESPENVAKVAPTMADGILLA